MNSLRKISRLLILLFIANSTVSAQVFLNNQIAAILDYHNRNGYGERVFLDMDRDLWFAGDEMRFSIFLAESKYLVPDAQSKIVSVELLDPSNQPLIREKFSIEGSGGAGILTLPRQLISGNYTIRAYTNWMRNDGPDVYFHETVTIMNPQRPPEYVYGGRTAPLKVFIEPEGGNLISGERNRVAVRLLNRFNRPFTDHCSLLTIGNDTIGRIQLDQNGIGEFYLTPQPGKSYVISVGDSLYTLPPASQDLPGIRITASGDQLLVQLVNRSNEHSLRGVHLFLHQHGDVYLYEKPDLSSDSIMFRFNKSALPGGISEVVLADSGFRVLASRLVWSDRIKHDRIGILPDPGTTGKREKVGLHLEAAPGSLVSVKVYLPAGDAPKQVSASNVLHINSDGGPWMSASPSDAELILAGSGNSGYSTLTSDKSHDYPPEIRSDFISGKLLNGTGNHAADFTLYMANVGENVDIETIDFRKDGSFILSPYPKADPSQIVFINDSLEKLNIQIHTEFSNEFTTFTTPTPDFKALTSGNFDKLLIASQLRRIYDQKDTVNPASTTFKFYGNPDESHLLSDYIELPVMEEFFRELFRYIVFTREEGNLKINVLSKYTNRILGPDPMYLVDGIPVFDTKTILDLDPATIKSIHIKANKYIYGRTTMDGIVDIESYAGDASVLDLDDKIASYVYEPVENITGREIERMNFPALRPGISDQRTVICWQPALRVGDDGTLDVHFMSSDITGTYHVEVTAISPEGVVSEASDALIVR